MNVAVRPLQERDLSEAERIFRFAFGTFLGLPDPLSFMGDADLVASRWRTDPAAAFGAYAPDGSLVGSTFTTNWGSFGFFGPLTVRPDLWDQGIAQKLLAANLALFERWGSRQVGLFTFPHSPKHLALYQKFGFWPQYLTSVMAKPVGPSACVGGWSTYSGLPTDTRETSLAQCRRLTNAVDSGLDLSCEVQAVAAQQLGDTVLVHDDTELVGFAICHVGKGSEAGSGAAYVKFGAARPGVQAARDFARLLQACEDYARTCGVAQLMAGVSTARHAACQVMLERGYRTALLGVAMQRSNQPGHNRPDCFVIDDWR